MQLDPLTLMIPGIIATAFAGLLLFGAWFYNNRSQALLWWGAANSFNAAGIALIATGLVTQHPILTAVGVGVTTFAPAMFWGGARQFNNASTPILVLMAGFAAWLIMVAFPFGLDNQRWSNFASLVAWSIYLPAAIWELWRSRREALAARWPLMGFLAVHALVFIGAAIETIVAPPVLNQPPALTSWFGIIHFETTLFVMGSAFCMVLICKERIVLGYMEAARVDPLTGTANRAAFFESATRLYQRCREQQAPCSLIMFDLDRFKLINDTFGHQVGDRILRDFADTVRLSLRPNDLFGRYGGEEFLVVLPGASIETAYVIAERVRSVFASGNAAIEGKSIPATVSAGVTSTHTDIPLGAMIEAADQAMYSAKRAGRNRVERAVIEDPAGDSKVVRIA